MPGTILDVFNGEAFSCVSMTESINKLPYIPARLGKLFKFQGINTLTVAIEEKAGKLSLIPNKTRNSGSTTKRPATRRKVRDFRCAHLPYDDAIMADDIQGVRAFGSTDKLETIADKVNETLASLRQDHEVTHEYHRVGAIQGRVLDADGSTTIYNLFTEFGLTEQTVDFELDDPLTDVKKKCSDVRRIIEGKLGGLVLGGITCQCGDGFWDMLVAHPEVKKAYERAAENKFAREDQRSTGGFEFCGIFFENYRGKVGSVDFIASNTARFYPEGMPGLFTHYGAPANWIETVNTMGLPIYAKQVPMKGDVGVEAWSQSNPLIICTRPETLVKGTTTVVEI